MRFTLIHASYCLEGFGLASLLTVGPVAAQVSRLSEMPQRCTAELVSPYQEQERGKESVAIPPLRLSPIGATSWWDSVLADLPALDSLWRSGGLTRSGEALRDDTLLVVAFLPTLGQLSLSPDADWPAVEDFARHLPTYRAMASSLGYAFAVREVRETRFELVDGTWLTLVASPTCFGFVIVSLGSNSYVQSGLASVSQFREILERFRRPAHPRTDP